MRYTTFGRRTGLWVSKYALGTGNFGTRWGAGADYETAKGIFDTFVAADGNFIDTADIYQAGESEEIVGRLIRADRDHFVLSTKYTFGIGQAGLPTVGNSRKSMNNSVEESLKRLGTDFIDFLWVHVPDAVTPMEEIARGLDDLCSAGKIRYAGLSNFPAWRTVYAVDLADRYGWLPVSAIQIEYSLAERTADRELLPMADALGLGVATWSPLGGGLLTGKYRSSDQGRLSNWGRGVQQEDSAHKVAVVDAVIDVAYMLDVAPADVAMAWLLEHTNRETRDYVPVVGPRSRQHLEGYLRAMELQLPPDVIQRLDEVSAVALGIPHEANLRHATTLMGTEPSARPLARPVP